MIYLRARMCVCVLGDGGCLAWGENIIAGECDNRHRKSETEWMNVMGVGVLWSTRA